MRLTATTGQVVEERVTSNTGVSDAEDSSGDISFDPSSFDVEDSNTETSVDTGREEERDEEPATFPARSVPKRAPQFMTSHAKLTTAADLMRGTSSPVAGPTFSVGMSVRHPRLGVGSVVAAQGLGKWQTVTVAFSSGETQSFVAHKCPLQPVGLM
jgi:hypothetical protein